MYTQWGIVVKNTIISLSYPRGPACTNDQFSFHGFLIFHVQATNLKIKQDISEQ